MTSTLNTSDLVQDWPLWWFARLEAAIERGDYRIAAEALRELERLGITVRYCGRHGARKAVPGA